MSRKKCKCAGDCARCSRRTRGAIAWALGTGAAYYFLARAGSKAGRTQQTALGRVRAKKEFPSRLPAKRKLWALLLDESGISYPPDFVREDARFLAWENKYAKNRGPKPVYAGGETDAVNEWLSLRGDDRVSGPYEGFKLLTKNVRTWDQLADSGAIGVLQGVPGLKRLRLPEAVVAQRVEKAQARHYAQQQREFDEAATLTDIGAEDTLTDIEYNWTPF